jgi:hypothetical protein
MPTGSGANQGWGCTACAQRGSSTCRHVSPSRTSCADVLRAEDHDVVFGRLLQIGVPGGSASQGSSMSETGTLLPGAKAAACPQLAKADFASFHRPISTPWVNKPGAQKAAGDLNRPTSPPALGRGRFSASQAALRLPSSLSPSPSHTRALPQKKLTSQLHSIAAFTGSLKA